jgi:hypothetical protein
MGSVAAPIDERSSSRFARWLRRTVRGRTGVSLTDVFRARERGDAEYRRVLSAFEADHGELLDSYWSMEFPGVVAVAVAERRPGRIARLLGKTPEVTLHRSTEAAVRNEPELAKLLLDIDRQHMRAANVLSGMSRRISMFTFFASIRHVITYLEYLRVTDLRADRRARDKAKVISAHEEILAEYKAYYGQAASREAQLVYLGGMLVGFILLCAAAIGLGFFFDWADVPGIQLDLFLGCLIAGSIGAVVSVLMRMNSGKFSVNHEIGREYVRRLGSFRPAIGAVFAIFTYFALIAGYVPGITIPADDPPAEFALFLLFGFLVGFSERLAKEMIATTGQTLVATPVPVEPEAPSQSAAAPRRATRPTEESSV